MPGVPLRRPRAVDGGQSDGEADGRSPSPAHLTPHSHGSASKRPRLSPDEMTEFQPGSIVRVKLQNFVTYTTAEFFPGPSLNMVIGPNGTGKSTLVCAICLGLGSGAALLGRAKEVSEYVKHGCADAVIEIELARQPGVQAENPIVRRQIIREGNKSHFTIDGRPSTAKGVQNFAKEFSIQIDNLCQFLPQDKVCEFAALSPVELLHSTQRAAAPPRMLELHDQLKESRAEQKWLQSQQATDRETLTNLEGRQHMLQADVDRLRERSQIQERIEMLEKTRPFARYRQARARNLELKQQKKAAQQSLKSLEEEVEPSLRAVNAKQEYCQAIEREAVERKRTLDRAEQSAEDMVKKQQEVQDKINDLQKEIAAERDGEKTRRQDIIRLEGTIKTLERQMEEAPVEFDAPAYNERIREKTRAVRELQPEIARLRESMLALTNQGRERNQRIARAQDDLKGLDSQAGQQGLKLKNISNETARAWEWIKDHQQLFEHRVYGPPILECSVKDPQYLDAIESLFQKNDFLTFTTQSKNDYRILGDHLYDELKLADITIQCCSNALDSFQPPLSAERMRELGFNGWALDFVAGPEPVLAMLCNELRLHQTGVVQGDISDEQYEAIQESNMSTWVTGKSMYQITRRREYGPGATSTRVRDLKRASVWTNQPVDVAAKRELQENIQGWQDELEAFKGQIEEAKRKTEDLRKEALSLDAEKKELEEEKAAKQRAKHEFDGLPTKKHHLEQQIRAKVEASSESKERLYSIVEKIDQKVLEKGGLARDYAAAVEKLLAVYEDLCETEIMRCEAESELEVLTSRNRSVKEMLEERRREVEQTTREAEEATKKAREFLAECKDILAEDENDRQKNFMADMSENQTIEDIETEIESANARLELVHGGNPNAIAEFESRQRTVERLREKVSKAEEKLEEVARQIATVRGEWEPELDRLVGSISEAFSNNFEKIGCAGQVGVHKDEDFDQWSIEIQVKFRENEALTLLTSHRQSGGERAVSTIFYLMSLQSLAKAPFRVVDEINQGMDPRNERTVHERMVEIACQEHTSQYFLITPKLLHDLRYHPRMKVLCIASGEYMPDCHGADAVVPSLLDFKDCVRRRRALGGGGAGGSGRGR